MSTKARYRISVVFLVVICLNQERKQQTCPIMATAGSRKNQGMLWVMLVMREDIDVMKRGFSPLC